MTDRDSPYSALARVAAQVVRAGSTAVSYAVTHTGTPMEPVDIHPLEQEQLVADVTAMFQAGRTGFQLHTWASESRRPDEPHVVPSTGHVAYRGGVLVNPGYADGSAGITEVLVALRHDPWSPSYPDAVMLAQAAKEVADAAARNGVPVLFLQSPVSPFRNTPRRYRGDGSGEAPRTANTLALRVVLGESTPGQRMDTFTTLTETADRLGFGLDVMDRRLGRVKGQWWTVVRSDPHRYQQHQREVADWVPQSPVESVLLVTAAGPSRLGSTAAILADLAARNVGVTAVSAVNMRGVAFVNLVVPVALVRRERIRKVSLVAPIGEGFGFVAAECALTTRRSQRRSPPSPPILSGPAGDFYTYVSGPFLSVEPKPAGIELPLWATWTCPLGHGRRPNVPALLLRRLAEEPALRSTPRVEYQRVTLSSGSRVVGRAKVTVALRGRVSQPDVPGVLTDVCTRVTQATIDELTREYDVFHGMEVALDWRERWVGHNSPE